jgi:glycosyltransferase involved in cell wall biosynthesis
VGKTRVCVLTDFFEADSTYSLNIVAEDQLAVLKRAGYDPIGVVQEDFQPQRIWSDVEIRHIPRMPHHNQIKFVEDHDERVAELTAALDEALDGVDVVITHDMIYQPAELILNFAAHRWAKEHPNVTWLNWVHSFTPSAVWSTPDPRLREVQTHMRRSFVVYPNHWAVERVARNFRCEVDQVAVVPHPTDTCGFLGFQDITTRFVQDTRLLDYDFIMTYPVRLDRGKQVEHVMNVAAGLWSIGRGAAVVVVDFHSTGGDKVEYRNWLKKHAKDLGIADHVHFTSEYDESLRLRAPREMVRDLMLISNVFMMPSKSETYSLIAQEAALCGNFLVLNWDFQPFLSIYGEHAAYFKFSANVDIMDRHLPPPPPGQVYFTNTDYGDEGAVGYARKIALRVAYEHDHNDVMNQRTRVRKERNSSAIFRRYIEPLFQAYSGAPR